MMYPLRFMLSIIMSRVFSSFVVQGFTILGIVYVLMREEVNKIV